MDTINTVPSNVLELPPATLSCPLSRLKIIVPAGLTAWFLDIKRQSK